MLVLPHPVILANVLSFGVQTKGIGFIISWATNVPVVVEASSTSFNPIWSPVTASAPPRLLGVRAEMVAQAKEGRPQQDASQQPQK